MLLLNCSECAINSVRKLLRCTNIAILTENVTQLPSQNKRRKLFSVGAKTCKKPRRSYLYL